MLALGQMIVLQKYIRSTKENLIQVQANRLQAFYSLREKFNSILFIKRQNSTIFSKHR